MNIVLPATGSSVHGWERTLSRNICGSLLDFISGILGTHIPVTRHPAVGTTAWPEATVCGPRTDYSSQENPCRSSTYIAES